MYIKMQNLMEESGDYVFLTHEATGILYSDKIVPALRPDGDAVAGAIQEGVRSSVSLCFADAEAHAFRPVLSTSC